MITQDNLDSTTTEAVRSASPAGANAAVADVDFDKLRANAAEKGYEAFVFDAMVERSALCALVQLPTLAGCDAEIVRTEVGRHFRNRLTNAGSFRQAYLEELRCIRQLAPQAPETALRSVTLSINSFVNPSSEESEGLTRAQLMLNLLDQARTSASLFRAYGVEDQIVVKHLAKTSILHDAGIISKATKLIDDDKLVGIEARQRSRDKSAEAPIQPHPKRASPLMRGLSGLPGLSALADRVIPKKPVAHGLR